MFVCIVMDYYKMGKRNTILIQLCNISLFAIFFSYNLEISLHL